MSHVPPSTDLDREARRPTAAPTSPRQTPSGARRPPLHVAAIWGPPLIVVVLVIAVLAAAGRQQGARRWVAHTHAVLAAAQATLRDVQTAETGQRGYLLTGALPYRAPYDAAHRALAADTALLRVLTRDNAVQQRRLDVLTPSIAAKLAELDTTVRLREVGDSVGALALVRGGSGRRLMDEIRREVDSVTAEEDRLLAARQRREDRAAAALVFTVLAGGLAAGVLALLGNGILTAAATRAAQSAHAEAARAEALAITLARLQHQRNELQAENYRLEAHAAAGHAAAPA